MLTVKSRNIHGGEIVFSAATVIVCHSQEHNKDVIECYTADHIQIHAGPGSCEIIYGRVWVMNEHGKTVADYDLGGWEFAVKAA